MYQPGFGGNFDPGNADHLYNMARHGRRPIIQRFDEYYRCYPVIMAPGNERPELNYGSKILLPPSALDKVSKLHVQWPLLMELINGEKGRHSHAGVLEFIAEEGRAYIPQWMMETLGMEVGDMIQIRTTLLELAKMVKLQPQSTNFLEISDPKAVLERAFRNFVTGEDVSTGESQHSESPCSTTLGKRSRTPTALSIWAESRQPNCHEPERNRHGQKIWYCKRCSYSQAAHNRPRSLAKTLPSTGCSSNKLQDKKATILNKHLRAAIHEEAYNQALVNLITVHSLPYSLVEWPEWYAVLHTVNRMAPATVTQSRGQVPRLLEASFSSHREALACNIAASVTQIHFTIDTWSSPSQHGLLAIVAHFINDESRQPRKALLALRELKGAHSGDSLAEIFTEVIDSYGMRDKIGYFTLDNASNNDTMLRALANTFGFNPAHRRLRCHGHIINLAVQAFLFGKNKDASDEAMRQVTMLSRREHDGVGRRAETAQTWRQHGPLGMLHNLVVWIRSSTQRYQAFVQAAGRMIPQDNSTRWNSWYRMIHVALSLRKEVNSFIDDRYSDSDIGLDYLHPEHWQELQELHSFLEPFYEVTKDTQWDKSSLDEVICSMDFFVTHYKAAMKRYRDNVTMTDRIMTSWYKFDDYYTRTDDSPVYAAAILLHPSLRMAHMTEAWKDQAQNIEPAIRAVRTLWEDFKPEKEPEVEEDLSAYEAYKKRIYQSSSTHDEFDRFIEGPALPIGASSALSWWLETTQKTSYPSLQLFAISIFSIPAMSAEAERVFSGARRTVSWDRTRMSPKMLECTECLKHWIGNGLLDRPFSRSDPFGIELDTDEAKASVDDS